MARYAIHVYMVNQSWLYPSTKDSCLPCQEVDNKKSIRVLTLMPLPGLTPVGHFFAIQYTYDIQYPCDA
jgi:hypothetical protein